MIDGTPGIAYCGELCGNCEYILLSVLRPSVIIEFYETYVRYVVLLYGSV